MTDRICALTVVLDKDTRDDDLQPLIDAILMLKGVLQVSTRVTDLSEHIAYTRARNELSQALLKALQEPIR